MARKTSSAGETLDEIQSFADRAANWINDNPVLLLGSALGILVVAGGYGLGTSWRDSALDEAAAAVARVDQDYRQAMGAAPDAVELVEPANAEAARRTREEYLEQFLEIAAEYRGEPAGGIASLQAGQLQRELGQEDDAIATWSAAAETLEGSALAALLHEQVAASHEDAGRWLEAGESHRAAFDVEPYPLRYRALAAAGFAFAEAGDVERALEAWERLETDGVTGSIPDHMRSRLAELAATRQLP